MKLLPFVLFPAMLAIGSCASDDGKLGTAQQPSSSSKVQPAKATGNVIPVEIIVGSKSELDKQCSPKTPATTVFVVSPKQVYHCIGSKLLDHAEHDKGNPDIAAAIVRAATGDQIKWFSIKHTFTVTVAKHPKLGPQNPDAPNSPFGDTFALAPALEHVSPPVPNGGGKMQQRYKVSFNITTVGPVDPDLICSM